MSMVVTRRSIPAALLALAFAGGCKAKTDSAATDSPAPAAAAPSVTADPVAPDTFQVEMETSEGKVTIDVYRAWAPLGADRFYRLVNEGYFTDVRFFRVIPGFMAQFGMHGDPATHAKWREATIMDDPVKATNARGTVTFATRGPNTRSNQFFINFGDNGRLDADGFSPIGKVTAGMPAVDKLNGEYGEGPPNGTGPDQAMITDKGNEYLKAKFPNLDYIKSATVVPKK
jgi:peptidyl-prolyl cis-trans isomerase A (cyclophilin A)